MINLLEVVIDLAETIRQVVRPELGRLSSRAIRGVGISGDASFSIDILAEKALLNYLEDRHLPLAYYSEDRGLVKRVAQPEGVLIVDPIDGTRPAAAGFESACVSVALSRVRPASGPESRLRSQTDPGARAWDSGLSVENCTFEDLLIGCIQEIKNGTRFVAERGKGARIWDPGPGQSSPRHRAPTLSPNHDLNRLFWSFEVAGRPVKALMERLAPLINRSGVSGGCFLFNSSTYSLTRLLTGQLDAVVDIGERVVKEVPSSREELSQPDSSGVVGLFPYDLAAAYLIALESGCLLTDAYGKDLGPRPLFGDPEEIRLSCIAASNRPLHEKLIQFVEDAFAGDEG